MKQKYLWTLTIIPLLLWLAACTGAAGPEPGEQVDTTDYIVESTTINMMESFPLQVSVTVSGQLIDGCVVLDDIRATRDGDTFDLTVETHREGDVCTEALVPFERNVPLDVAGLPAGTYTVNVDDVVQTFTFAQDNTLEQPDAERDITITLERTRCFGACPVYTVTLYGDGRVEYNGIDFVDVAGMQTDFAGAEAVAMLADEMVAAGYFEWDDAYTRRYVTDLPTVITSLTIDGETKRIERYEGDDRAPAALVALEIQIDRLANSVQWTGQEPVEPEQVGMPNPASAYCEENGGTLEIRQDEALGQYGVCVFPDGSECEEWAFFRGECAPGSSDASADAQDSLAGTRWTLVEGNLDGAGLAAIEGQPVTLEFVDGQVSGNAGCNGYFGDYRVIGSEISVGMLGSTMKMCAEDVMDVEARYLAALQSAFDFSQTADQLILNAPNGLLIFAPSE